MNIGIISENHHGVTEIINDVYTETTIGSYYKGLGGVSLLL